MFTRKAIAVLALTALSGAAAAEWQLIGSNGKEFSLFIDPVVATRNGPYVSIPQMVTYGYPQVAYPEGQRFFSEKSQVDFDCAGKRMRVLATDQYSGSFTDGRVVNRKAETRAWVPVQSRTNMEVAWMRACNRL